MKAEDLQAYKLSPQQRRLWLLGLRRGSETQSRARALVQVSGPVDLGVLRRACELVATRHEALRTTFYRRAGMRLPLQVVRAEASVGWVEESGVLDEDAGLQVQVKTEEGGYAVELSVPALCADAASLRNLVSELERCYEAVTGGKSLQDEPMQYPDYADWQNELLEADDEEAVAGKAFWLRQDVAPTAEVKLPYEVSNERPAGFVLESISTQLNDSVFARLVSESETKSWTIEGYLLACWVTLLWQLCGREEITVGERVSGRKYAELESAVGLFEKWLPVRVSIDGSARLHELIEQVEARRSELSDWQDYYSGEPNGGDDGPASIGFSYEEEPNAAPSGLVHFTLVRNDTPAGEFKVKLHCLRRNNSLKVEIQYDASVLHRRHAEQLKNQFEVLLESALQNSGARVSDLTPLREVEREKLVRDFNRTEAFFPHDKTIHQLFEEQVARTPDRVAVISGQTRLTYAELNSAANQLARSLRHKGVRAGVCVALSIERSVEALVGILAVLKASGAYVPLSMEGPGERVMKQLSESQSPVLVLTERDILRDGESPYRSDDLKLPGASESFAYVIYTSGSTGVPKGVAVTHRNLVNYVHFICREFELYEASADAGLNFATVSTIAADLGHTVVFPSLITGGCLHILSTTVAADAYLFARYVQEHPIDVLKIVPSHLNALLATPEGAQLLPRRQLFLGGEAFTTDLLKTLVAMAPACEVINHYGPTEATVGALVNRLAAGEVTAAATVPVGRPIANSEAYVFDKNLHPVPVEVPGELYLGGEGLACGYLNQSAQTAERFIPHPYAKQPGARLYRTGDLVRHLPDGKIEFLGRADHQVKIHGYRVELDEIAAGLRQHPSIREAIVMLRDDAEAPKRLVGYVVCTPGAVLTAAELRAHLADRLPNYMVPAAYVFLDRLPLTPNGKVDRRALPAPSGDREGEKIKVAPRTEAERALMEIWREVLRLEQVGVYDNFFELGGDSIQSIQIVARARQKGLRLLPKQIFSAQTIAELAAVAKEDTVSVPGSTQEPVTGSMPLTPIQHWFFGQQLQNPHLFNQAVLLQSPAGIEGAHLRQALAHLLAHHDALRMRFKCEDGGWRQWNEEPGEAIPFAEVDLSHVAENECGAAIEAEAEKWQSSLNLGDGPLVRMVLIHLGEKRDARLLILAHHLVVDVVSWAILLEDLELAYEQISRAESVKLPPKTLSFKHWAERLLEFARSEKLAAEAPYWLNAVDRSVGALPCDNPSGRNDRASARTVTASLSADDTRALLKDVPRAYRTEIVDILLTALVRAVWKWGRQRALLVDLEGHGREQFDDELDVTRTVGWFTTHYPVRLELEEVDEQPAATLKRVKELLRAVPQHGLGFGLLKWMRGDEQIAEQLRLSPAKIKVNYLGQLDAALKKSSRFTVAPESSGTTQDESGPRSHWLELNGAVAGGSLHLRWTFAPEVHRPESVEQLVESYIKELRSLIQHCCSVDSRAFTPSDFPAAKLNQRELDSFTATLSAEKVEDIYQLSPMQEGLLFHGLLTPESDVYFRQLSCAVAGDLNFAALSSAWQSVIDRHPVLRTSFHWGGLKTPLQVVNRQVTLPLTQYDWRELSPDEQSTRLEVLIHEEGQRGFNLSQAPLMRLTVVRLGDVSHHLIWSYHHLLMDGWAKHSVIHQILECYMALCQETEISLSESRPYRDYIMWLQLQDMQKAEAYWRALLGNFDTATPIGARSSADGAGRQGLYTNKSIHLSEQTTSALQQLARSNRLTLNTLVQGAWGIFLSHISRRSDVVFGAVVSGRPPDLDGSERMIGLFVNTLPVRVPVEAGTELLGWLAQLQEQQVEMQQYEYSPLVMVQNWSGVPRGSNLFESLLVFENYPTEELTPLEQESGLWLSNFNVIEYSTFPLTLMIGPGRILSLMFLYDTRSFDVAMIERMLDRLSVILTAFAGAGTGTRLEEILAVIDDADRQDQLLKEKELKEFHLQKIKSVRRKVVRV